MADCNCSIHIYADQIIGVGSYGKVCRAKYGQLPCAAKILYDNTFQRCDQGISTFFEQECQFLTTIKHPNIVQFLCIFKDPDIGQPALLMELMDENLTRFLERSTGPLSYRTQLNICYDVALALAYLHSNSTIHKNLTSDNVLLIGAGSRAKVTDFEMSKLVDMNPRMTPLAQYPRTAVYMPPEALTTPPHYSNKLDCFSHGVLTIQIITRNLPSPGDATTFLHDSRFPTGRIIVLIPEVDRRKKDIDLIDPDHLLLPVAMHCLKDIETERPFADNLCEQLESLKKDLKDRGGMEQPQDQPQDQPQNQPQNQPPRGQPRDQPEDQSSTIQKLKQELEEKEEIINECRTELQKKTKELEKVVNECHVELLKKTEEHEREIEMIIEECQMQLQDDKEKNVQKVETLEAEKGMLNDEIKKCKIREKKILKELEDLKKPSVPIKKEKEKDAVTKESPRGVKMPKYVPVASVQKKSDSVKPPTLTWTQGKSPPEIMLSAYGAAVVHGITAYFAQNHNVYSYKLSDNKWIKLQACPFKWFGLEIVKENLITIGGLTSDDSPTNSLLSLTGSDSKQKWEELLPPMPTKRTNPATVSSQSYMIVAGGDTLELYDNELSVVEVMDTETHQWFIAKSLPIEVENPQLVLQGGYLYLADNVSVYSCFMEELLRTCRLPSDVPFPGGRSSGSDVWCVTAKIPVLNSSRLATLGSCVLALGGRDDKGMLTGMVHYYNRDTNSWSIIGEMLTPRANPLYAVLPNNVIVVVGGVITDIGGVVS